MHRCTKPIGLLIIAFTCHVGLSSAETVSEAAERSGSIASRIANFDEITAGDTRVVEWSIISYVDISSDINITTAGDQTIRVVGERVSREEAAYSIGTEQSYEHAFKATVTIPSDTTSGVATVGLYTYKRGDDSPKRMFALFPGNVVTRPVGQQAKGFEWGIKPYGSDSSSLTWPLPSYSYFYGVNVGEYNSPYGYHKGLDIFTSPAADVLAICDGTVVRNVTSDADRPIVWNKLLVIKHDDCNGQDVYAYYAHIYSSLSGTVVAGQKIGEVLSWPGSASNTHLHFGLAPTLIINEWGYGDISSVIYNEGWMDPRAFFDKWN